VAHNSIQYVHLIAEIEKRVFADRAEYLGDPDFVSVPVEELTAKHYLEERVIEVQIDVPSPTEDVAPGIESHQTTHFSIVDRWGNAVSNTYTLNWDFGAAVVVEGAGFLLNDEMDDFSVKTGVPNIYGVVGNDANAIAPGKRMLSSMAPTLVLGDRGVELVLGSPGGSTIFTSVFQVMVNLYDHGMTLEEAVGVTRFHHQLLPPQEITFDPDLPLPNEVIEGLREKGYSPRPHDWPLGDIQAIRLVDGRPEATSDPRGRGTALTVP
jgi:gamma-glutamyltranspeptidase/glutathione hydrolase